MEREKNRAGSGKEILSGGWRIVRSNLVDVTGVVVVGGVAIAVVLIWAVELEWPRRGATGVG